MYDFTPGNKVREIIGEHLAEISGSLQRTGTSVTYTAMTDNAHAEMVKRINTVLRRTIRDLQATQQQAPRVKMSATLFRYTVEFIGRSRTSVIGGDWAGAEGNLSSAVEKLNYLIQGYRGHPATRSAFFGIREKLETQRQLVKALAGAEKWAQVQMLLDQQAAAKQELVQLLSNPL